jgi:hypothetical protein
MDQAKATLVKIRAYWDDDVIDKLNYFWTTLILIFCAVTIGMKQYVGSPLQCWVPLEFKRYWEEYAEHYCFVENTYWVPINETIPDTGEQRVQQELGYYQWVPIVLALQALMFALPRFLWRMLNTQGLNVPAIVEASLEVKKGERDKKQRLKGEKEAKEHVNNITEYIDDKIKYRRAARGKLQTPAGTPAATDIDPGYTNPYRLVQPSHGLGSAITAPTYMGGYYTTLMYMFIKLLYIVNVIGQFFMMQAYLAPDYDWWGFGILNDMINGRVWHNSGHFPRVTLCDFAVRKLGQLQNYTIQCVLILNMLNEKLYLFLWWWFLLVAVLTALNLVYWLWISFSAASRRAFVARYLLVRNKIGSIKDENFKKFVDKYLKPDGVLVLRLISCNAGELATTKVVSNLFDLWDKPKDIVKMPPAVPPKPQQSAPISPASPNSDGFTESIDPNMTG